jgi:thiosulfate/3-mercaptopyruvate sulfurtransferase
VDHRTLISIEELTRRLNDPSLVVFDCRHDLKDPGAGQREYAAGHVPGARFADLDRDLSGPKTGTNGRHPLPDPEKFAAWLGACGVAPAMQVVAYDDARVASAPRLWWMLRRWFGHERAAVLDGGWEAWLAAGAPVTTERPRIVPTAPPPAPRAPLVDAAYVHAHLGDPRVVVVDARAPERFRGEVEPIDPVAGRIPGARNRPHTANREVSGRFKPSQALRADFEALLEGARPDQVVHHCGSGVNACHNLLAMEIAGLEGSRLYPGSWSEWCADASRPVERG